MTHAVIRPYAGLSGRRRRLGATLFGIVLLALGAAAQAQTLSVTKALDTANPTGGTSAIYHLTVVNSDSANAAQQVVVQDTLPPGVQYSAFNAAGWNCNHSGQVVECSKPELAAGTTETIMLAVMLPYEGGDLTNTCQWTHAGMAGFEGAGCSDTTTVTSPDAAQVTVQMNVSESTVIAGRPVVWSILIRNSGQVAIDSLLVTNHLPPNNDLYHIEVSNGYCHTSSSVECHVGELDPGEEAGILIETIPHDAGVVSLSCDVVGGGLVNGLCEASIQVEKGLLGVNKYVPGGATAVVGGQLPYVISVNNGYSLPVTDVVVVDTLPFEVSYNGMGSPSNGWSCVHDGSQFGGVVECSKAEVSASTVDEFLIVTAAPDYPATVVNTCDWSYAEQSVPAGNGCTVTTDIVGTPDLELEMEVQPGQVRVGDDVVWLVSARNSGNGPSRNTSVYIELASGLSFVEASSTTSGVVVPCYLHGSTVDCELPDLEPGEHGAITLSTIALEEGAITNTCSATYRRGEDEGTLGSACQATVQVEEALPDANVSVSMNVSASSVPVSSDLVYTLNVRNLSSAGAATGVVVETQLPAASAFLSAAGPGWTCEPSSSPLGGTARCSKPQLAAGANDTLTLTTRAPSAPGPITAQCQWSYEEASGPQGPAGCTATTQVTAASNQDITASKTVSSSTVNVDEEVTWQIAVTNDGDEAVEGVVVYDILPSGLRFESAQSEQAVCSYSIESRIVTCQAGTLAAGGGATIHVTTTVRSAGRLANQCLVETSEGTVNFATPCSAVVNATDGGSQPPSTVSAVPVDDWRALLVLVMVLMTTAWVVMRPR